MRSTLPSHPTPDQVEQSFYEAMQSGRLDALMACLTDDEDPVCIHPGGPRLTGVQAIRESFSSLFEHGPVTVQPEVVHQALHGSTAVHSVLERVLIESEEGTMEVTVLATNVYVLTAQGWKMAVHHASPGTRQPLASVPYPSKNLH